MNYTIPNKKRELKRLYLPLERVGYYTIPNKKRELKLCIAFSAIPKYYTIPNKKRELKPANTALGTANTIIPYQTKKGN